MSVPKLEEPVGPDQVRLAVPRCGAEAVLRVVHPCKRGEPAGRYSRLEARQLRPRAGFRTEPRVVADVGRMVVEARPEVRDKLSDLHVPGGRQLGYHAEQLKATVEALFEIDVDPLGELEVEVQIPLHLPEGVAVLPGRAAGVGKLHVIIECPHVHAHAHEAREERRKVFDLHVRAPLRNRERFPTVLRAKHLTHAGAGRVHVTRLALCAGSARKPRQGASLVEHEQHTNHNERKTTKQHAHDRPFRSWRWKSRHGRQGNIATPRV